MNRESILGKIQSSGQNTWDILIIGGGATGLGIAMDAASRGYKTLLLEQSDFAKGTSSRSTKLIHGGVRYLAQGYIRLVLEALHERGLLMKNAPHLVRNTCFVMPQYKWWKLPFFTAGLKAYDLLAGRLSLGKSEWIAKNRVTELLPGIKTKGLKGGVIYHDGQFDDARMAVNLAQTVVEHGGAALNYFRTTGLLKTGGRISGVTAVDLETGIEYSVTAKTVINATGVFVDDILQMDNPGSAHLVRPSQGVHLVVDKAFLGATGHAMMIPQTEDGRVLFAVPWHDKLLLGTTDTPLDTHSLEPRALEEEIEFILRTAGNYLAKAPSRKDVLSVFAGLRPLAAPQDSRQSTREISRSHKIIVSSSGLITITGGKWTTFRKMAEDTVNKAIALGDLPAAPCTTAHLRIHGYTERSGQSAGSLHIYGSDAEHIRNLIRENPEWEKPLHPGFDYNKAMVVWAVREEMAGTVEDVLARRLRALFLDARAAVDMAPGVAAIMAKELGKDAAWQQQQVADFTNLAAHYLPAPYLAGKDNRQELTSKPNDYGKIHTGI